MGFESKSNLPKPPVQTHSVSSEKSHIPSSSEHGTSQSAFEQELEKILKSASNLNGNLNCSKELEHYASW